MATPGKLSMRQTSQYGIQGAVRPSTGVVGIFPQPGMGLTIATLPSRFSYLGD